MASRPSRRHAMALVAVPGLARPLPARAAEPLRYGGDRHFPPFESLDADGRPRGFQVDLLREVGAVGGFEVAIELADWSRVVEDFAHGRVDVVAAVPTPARAATALFTRAYATVPFGVYVRRSTPQPQSLQDLAGKRIAVRDSATMQATQALLMGLQPAAVVAEPGAHAALRAVLDGRADLALLPQAYGGGALASGAFAGLEAADFEVPLQSYAFAVAEGREALRDRLDAALSDLERSGQLQALRERWFDPAAARAAAERDAAQGFARVAWGLGGAALLGAGLLLVGLRRRSRALVAERERRQAVERERDEIRDRLALAFDRNPDPMLLSERDTRTVVDVNEAACRLLGVARDELPGTPLHELPGLLDASAIDRLGRLIDADGVVDGTLLALRAADGSVRDCLVTCEPCELGGRDHVFTLARDITELERSQQGLRDTLAQLDAALDDARRRMWQAALDKARSERELAAYATHVARGLNDPVRAVHGFVGRLQADVDAGRLDAARASARHVATASQRMDRMVGGLQRLARLAQAELHPVTIDMTAIVRGLFKRLAAERPTPAVDCRVGTLPPAVGDLEMVVQLWHELLHNAWTYARESTQRRVGVDHVERDGAVWYRVTDDGVGFDASAVADPFVPFQRLHAGRRHDGVGIGLCAAHRIVRRHGGDIVLRSTPGVGTVVEFRLGEAPAGPGAAGTATADIARTEGERPAGVAPA